MNKENSFVAECPSGMLAKWKIIYAMVTVITNSC